MLIMTHYMCELIVWIWGKTGAAESHCAFVCLSILTHVCINWGECLGRLCVWMWGGSCCRVSQEECVNWTDGGITSTNASPFNLLIVIVIIIINCTTPSAYSSSISILPMSVNPLVSFCVWTPSWRILTPAASHTSPAQKCASQSGKVIE